MTDMSMTGNDPRKYVQICADLREKLTAGVIPAGHFVVICSISQEWGVSRQTVAKALCTLENDGLLTRYPGLGYYVPSRR